MPFGVIGNTSASEVE
jgi:hypothetical protein